MARKGKGAAIMLALGAGAGIALLTSKQSEASVTPKSRTLAPEEIMALAEKYGKAFGVPPQLLLAIWEIESNFKTGAVNRTERAAKFGNAWGMGQVLLTTAQDMTKNNPNTAKAYWPSWDGTGNGLLDPNVNAAMSAFYLAQSLKRYSGKPDPSFMLAGLSYHQGRGNVDKFLKEHAGGKIDVTKLPPAGKAYWLKLKDYYQYVEPVS